MIEWKTQNTLVSYEEALAWMKARVTGIQEKTTSECVWLLEHSPLYTLGTSAKIEDVLPSAPLPFYNTGRGGQVTYHGPGQRIAYLMLNLKTREKDIKWYVTNLEEWIIKTLATFGIKGERRPGRIGIWVQDKGVEAKIAALGVRIQKWVTSHGIAINVNPDLTAYDHIVPCGLKDYGVTSLKSLGVDATLEDVDEALKKNSPFL